MDFLNRVLGFQSISDQYNDRGIAFYDQNKLDDAIKEYTKAIELDPKYTNAYYNRGLVFKQQNKLDDAIKDYTRAIELDPKYTNAYCGRGIAFQDQNKLNDAIKDYTRAIELDPKYTVAYNNRGNAFKLQNKLNDAIKDYTRAIELNPNDPLYLSNIGQFYLSQMQFEHAHQYIKQAQDIFENTNQEQLIKQYDLSLCNIQFIKQSLQLLNKIQNNLQKSQVVLSYSLVQQILIQTQYILSLNKKIIMQIFFQFY